jgi:hypothetical protein
LNLRPSGYEPDELPGCSIPRHQNRISELLIQKEKKATAELASGAAFLKL